MEELIGQGLSVGLTNVRWIETIVHTSELLITPVFFFPLSSGENLQFTLLLGHEALMATSDMSSFC